MILYADGTPRTRHLVTNTIIEVDESAGRATARSYNTTLQQVPGAGGRDHRDRAVRGLVCLRGGLVAVQRAGHQARLAGRRAPGLHRRHEPPHAVRFTWR